LGERFRLDFHPVLDVTPTGGVYPQKFDPYFLNPESYFFNNPWTMSTFLVPENDAEAFYFDYRFNSCQQSVVLKTQRHWYDAPIFHWETTYVASNFQFLTTTSCNNGNVTCSESVHVFRVSQHDIIIEKDNRSDVNIRNKNNN
jgi:hypothetical protein